MLEKSSWDIVLEGGKGKNDSAVPEAGKRKGLKAGEKKREDSVEERKDSGMTSVGKKETFSATKERIPIREGARKKREEGNRDGGKRGRGKTESHIYRNLKKRREMPPLQRRKKKRGARKTIIVLRRREVS